MERRNRRPSIGTRWPAAPTRSALLLAALATAAPREVTAQTGQAARALDAVRSGGVTVVCRHAITDSFSEREPVDYDDPTTQRRLSPAGERQVEEMGRAIRALGIDVAEVVASPMDRATQTASSMFGGAPRVDSLWHTNGGGYDGPARDRRREALRAPVEGGARFIVSHIGTMRSVLPDIENVREGDCVVVRPGGEGDQIVGVVPWRAWAAAARRR